MYGAEAVIPTDIEFDSPRATMYTEAEAKEAHEDGVDLLEEGRLLALSRSTIYQQSLHRTSTGRSSQDPSNRETLCSD